ncbi:MAG: carboxylesterase [Rhodobacteraceae bacterium]|nr:carboxylesterase [Paracoccaceae bacterium]
MAMIMRLIPNMLRVAQQAAAGKNAGAQGGAEAAATRAHDTQLAALAQYAAEFEKSQRSGFDKFMDNVNRTPRPLFALACLGILAMAMVAPDWFEKRMETLDTMPTGLWSMIGLVISFYFGGRFQTKWQDSKNTIVNTLANALPVDTLLSREKQRQSAPESRPIIDKAVAAANAALQELKSNSKAG